MAASIWDSVSNLLSNYKSEVDWKKTNFGAMPFTNVSVGYAFLNCIYGVRCMDNDGIYDWAFGHILLCVFDSCLHCRMIVHMCTSNCWPNIVLVFDQTKSPVDAARQNDLKWQTKRRESSWCYGLNVVMQTINNKW